MSINDDLNDKLHELNDELAELEGTTATTSIMRRIVLNNCLSDYFYLISEALEKQGGHTASAEAHRTANRHWGRVCADVADLELPEPEDKEMILK